MKDIPVTFHYKDKQYNGILTRVAGSGSTSLYHLMVDNFYWGQLIKTYDGWRFHSNSEPLLSNQEDYFGEMIEKAEKDL